MYARFYGLTEMPFNVTPDPRFLYLSPSHQEAISHLRYGIEERKGFIVLTGEVGCGKTTLCRTLLNELDPETYETALILNPRINEQQLLNGILRELGEPTNNTSDVTHRINDALLRRIEAGKNIVLIIDEAQNLSFEVLEQIRLLSNLETDSQKLLQVVLMGQPELKERLREPRLRQLKQRILVYYDLPALNLADTIAYIHHRLSLAGGQGRPRFTRAALRAVYRNSKGIPRLVNNICDRSLLSAYIKNTDDVTFWDVRRALRDIRRLG